MGPTISVIAQQSPYYYHVPGDSAKSIYISLPVSSNAQVKYLQLWHRVNGALALVAGPGTIPSTSVHTWNLNNPAYYSASGATPPVVDARCQSVD